ncbi:hypothetical protein [Georgenia wangjunii]|uniref:hypothetical protein n=1 Tax=Georgenia wangjunii TaxID=3117730 RepID=UPI002F269423
MAFPDAREAVAQLLTGMATRHGELAVYDVRPTDFEEHLPVAIVYRVGGTQAQTERVDRITVEVYAPATSPGNQTAQVADDVSTALADRYHVVAGVGVIDWVDVESVPVDVPFPSDVVGQYVATYRLTTRPE